MKNLLIASALLAFSGLAHSATIDFNNQVNFTNADGYTEQGVTFTSSGVSTNTTSLIFSSGTPAQGISLLSTGDGSYIRADFNGGFASSVAIDIGDNNQDADTLFLSLFNSSNALISTVSQDIIPSFIGLRTLSLSLPTANIAYVLFGSTGAIGNGGIFADNFTFEVATPSAVPIPAAAILFAPALLGFMGLRRKAKKQA